MTENFLRAALEQGKFFCSAELVLGRDHSIPDADSFVKDLLLLPMQSVGELAMGEQEATFFGDIRVDPIQDGAAEIFKEGSF